MPEPGQGLAQTAQRVQQLEVAGGAAVRGSWEHMWGSPEVEVQQPEVAGSTEVQQPEVAGSTEVQQPEVAGGTEVQQPEVAGSTEVQQPEVAGGAGGSGSAEQLLSPVEVQRYLQQAEVMEAEVDSEYSGSECSDSECQHRVHEVLVAEVAGLVAYGLESRAVSEPSWMQQHELKGHPYDKRCPWRVQGRLKQKQHLQQLAGSGTEMAGSTVKVDLTGPYEPGVTGSTWALVGVHEESDWGYVGLQQSKAAPAPLVSIQSLAGVQLRADSGGRAAPIARFHHDDDKSFRGVVEEYARQQGWLDTHTGGYNPNANAKAEVMIGMLKQRVRVLLLACTGGTLYCEQLWDVAFVYCNTLLNVDQWPDRDLRIARLTGMSVPRDNTTVYLVATVCIASLKRIGLVPPSRLLIWECG